MNQALSIGSMSIRQDEHGRYCLSDLFRASGGLQQHRPSKWLANKQAQELIAEISEARIRASEAGIPALTVVKGGNNQGTYACRELVYCYAMWISAAFHLKVIRSYDALMLGKEQPAQAQLFTQPCQATELTEAAATPAPAVLQKLCATQARLIELLEAQLKPKAKREHKPVTEDEVRLARALKAQGMSNRAIARQIGRNEGTVSLLTRVTH